MAAGTRFDDGNKQPGDASQGPAPAELKSLGDTLASDNALERIHARRHLVAAGAAAVDILADVLTHAKDPQPRWEAAKALAELAQPAAAPALVHALDDPRGEIRWLAAEGLIALGPSGAKPLVETLVRGAESIWLREGTHHVFHELVKRPGGEPFRPILEALVDYEPALSVPAAAKRVLDTLVEKH